MKKLLFILSFVFVQFISAQVTNEPIETVEVDEDENTIYSVASVESRPEFPGGMVNFHKFITSNFRQPSDINYKGGKIYVQFVIEKDGSLTNIHIKDIGFGTKEEAIRVLNASPKWQSAEKNGQKVRCTYLVPILLQTKY